MISPKLTLLALVFTIAIVNCHPDPQSFVNEPTPTPNYYDQFVKFNSSLTEKWEENNHTYGLYHIDVINIGDMDIVAMTFEGVQCHLRDLNTIWNMDVKKEETKFIFSLKPNTKIPIGGSFSFGYVASVENQIFNILSVNVL
ncbi:hypothetical protein CYY_005697 [Polysphondylium violaceum]|uniref:Carbohydrate binding domain-containing protein n=1 Tax=Polysphondylium violaceum TaxID=133409 RepID=A0A8J4PSG2_9MYCE|nr:hypothetical protein CYY_005697 [Polysphondylium violaceum]